MNWSTNFQEMRKTLISGRECVGETSLGLRIYVRYQEEIERITVLGLYTPGKWEPIRGTLSSVFRSWTLKPQTLSGTTTVDNVGVVHISIPAHWGTRVEYQIKEVLDD